METRYQVLVEAVERAINQADPIGLLEIGAPSDEYAPEIGTIVPRVVSARQLDEVTAVLHEEFLRGPAGDLVAELKHRHSDVRGEITLLIGKVEAQTEAAAPTPKNIGARLEQIMAEHELDEKSALKILAKEMGVSKSEAYRELQRMKAK